MTVTTVAPAPPEQLVYDRPPLNSATFPMAAAAPFALTALAAYLGAGFHVTKLAAIGAAISVVLFLVGLLKVAATRRRHREVLATPSTGYEPDEDEDEV